MKYGTFQYGTEEYGTLLVGPDIGVEVDAVAAARIYLDAEADVELQAV